MHPLRMQAFKAQAIKKHKAQQMLNDFILYSLTTLACTSFCSSPLWYPPFCAIFNVFFFFSLPKITSLFFTSKFLFVVVNLIVIFLLRECMFFASMSKAYNYIYHDKYKCKPIDQLQVVTTSHEHNGEKIEICESKSSEENNHEEFFELCNDEETCESHVDQMVELCSHNEEESSCSGQQKKVVEGGKHEGSEGDPDESLPAEELNKLVDDFIDRIKRQRRLEAEFSRG